MSQKTENRFYEDYGNSWLANGRKKYELLASEWKTKKILSLLSKFPELKFNSILDFGCGPAYILKKLSLSLNINKCYGVDISSSMIRSAKKHFPVAKYCKMKNLSEFNKAVDVVLLIDVLEHVPNQKQILEEVKRIAKYQIIKIPLENTPIRNFIRLLGMRNSDGHINFWSKNSFTSFLKNLNFTIIGYWEGNPPKKIEFFSRKQRENLNARKMFFLNFYDLFRKFFFNSKKLYSSFFISQLFILTKYCPNLKKQKTKK
ncbi:class I SAM-dependent methyltransferase [Candidatus Woesearchaeota archaeon]|nr:class I SAM-dependent methyltransferase [Candidatus Woesearchaeota archaeon]